MPFGLSGDDGDSRHGIQNTDTTLQDVGQETGDAKLQSPMSQLITLRHLLVWPIGFLFTLAYNCTPSVFTQYVNIKVKQDNFPNLTLPPFPPVCEMNTTSMLYLLKMDLELKAAKWEISVFMAGALVAIISSFLLGTYTDRFGRKFLFILPIIGTVIRTVGVVVGIKNNMSLTYYIIFYFIEGCTGQIFTIFQICYIYVCDITQTGQKRSIGMVLIEVAFGLATAGINIIAGYIAKSTSFLVPYYFSLSLLGVTLILVLLLPETYPKDVRNTEQSTTVLGNLKNPLFLYISSQNKGKRWIYIVNLIALSFISYSVFGRTALEGSVLLNTPLCMAQAKIDIFSMFRTGFQQLLGIGLVFGLLRFTGDNMIAVIGSISYGISFLIEGLATTSTVLYIGSVVGVFGILTQPMIQSAMSQMTSSHKQGAVFASITMVQCIMNVVTTMASSAIYESSMKTFPGLAFIVFAGFSMVASCLLLIIFFGTRNSSPKFTQFS